MNQSFYIGAVGAQQQLRHMNVRGDNIANVNTYGFKADKARFNALMYENLRGVEEDELPTGVGMSMLMTSTDFAPGGVATTNRDFDYMIEGEGFFAVVDLTTNEISFTRNGAFMMAERQRATGETDENGNPVMETAYYLSDGEGRFVLGQNGGLIEITDIHAKQPVGIFDYINCDGMTRLTGTRFLPIDKNGGVAYGEGELIQGAVETSNTDLAEEISKVIEAQRAYGLALKMVQTSDEVESTINSLRS